jgi:hypothetical protein
MANVAKVFTVENICGNDDVLMVYWVFPAHTRPGYITITIYNVSEIAWSDGLEKHCTICK